VSIEYLTEFKSTSGGSYHGEDNVRHRLVAKYAWAIPNEEALETIAKYGPIVEIGAGNGYWAFLLRSMGVEVKAFDLQTNLKANRFFEPTRDRDEPKHWTKVEQGGSEKAQQYSDHSLHDVELIGVRRPTDARWSSFGWTVVKVEPQAPFDY
jgi:hypothetical protein